MLLVTDTWRPTMALSVESRCNCKGLRSFTFLISYLFLFCFPLLLSLFPSQHIFDNNNAFVPPSTLPSTTLRKMVEVKFSPRAEWWQNMMYPVRRVWAGLAIRLRIRKTGLLKLRHDVRACEYEDIRVMWEMLNKNESDAGNSPRKTNKRRNYWKLFRWARCAPYINCRS